MYVKLYPGTRGPETLKLHFNPSASQQEALCLKIMQSVAPVSYNEQRFWSGMKFKQFKQMQALANFLPFPKFNFKRTLIQLKPDPSSV